MAASSDSPDSQRIHYMGPIGGANLSELGSLPGLLLLLLLLLMLLCTDPWSQGSESKYSPEGTSYCQSP